MNGCSVSLLSSLSTVSLPVSPTRALLWLGLSVSSTDTLGSFPASFNICPEGAVLVREAARLTIAETSAGSPSCAAAGVLAAADGGGTDEDGFDESANFAAADNNAADGPSIFSDGASGGASPPEEVVAMVGFGDIKISYYIYNCSREFIP